MTSLDDKETQSIFLADGRTLAYAEYGDLTGTPILCMHGTPSCRLEYRLWEPSAQKLNARLIVPDRPGMGLSTNSPGRNLLDWPRDVQTLTQQLQLDRYHVLGGSGGGPFALACAKELPESQILSVNVWAGSGPPEMGLKGMTLLGRSGLFVWKWMPSLMSWFDARFVAPAATDPDPKVTEAFLLKTAKYQSKEEQALFEDPFYMDVVRDTFRETYRQGGDGANEEMRILGENWGFRLEDIEAKRIRFFYGTADTNTPIRMGRYMQDRLKGATLKEFLGKTHFTIDDDKGEAILQGVLQA